MKTLTLSAAECLTWIQQGTVRRGTSCRNVSWCHEPRWPPCPGHRTAAGRPAPSSVVRLKHAGGAVNRGPMCVMSSLHIWVWVRVCTACFQAAYLVTESSTQKTCCFSDTECTSLLSHRGGQARVVSLWPFTLISSITTGLLQIFYIFSWHTLDGHWYTLTVFYIQWICPLSNHDEIICQFWIWF